MPYELNSQVDVEMWPVLRITGAVIYCRLFAHGCCVFEELNLSVSEMIVCI